MTVTNRHNSSLGDLQARRILPSDQCLEPQDGLFHTVVTSSTTTRPHDGDQVFNAGERRPHNEAFREIPEVCCRMRGNVEFREVTGEQSYLDRNGGKRDVVR